MILYNFVFYRIRYTDLFYLFCLFCRIVIMLKHASNFLMRCCTQYIIKSKMYNIKKLQNLQYLTRAYTHKQTFLKMIRNSVELNFVRRKKLVETKPSSLHRNKFQKNCCFPEIERIASSHKEIISFEVLQ